MTDTDYIKKKRGGFTLIELLIAMAIASVVTAAIYSVFVSQQKSYTVQEEVVEMQQNLRAGMDMMVREIRMAGYDPESIGGLGIVDITPRDIDNNVDSEITGNGALQFASDFDGDGAIATGETVSFSIFDSPVSNPDGNFDLARDTGGGRQLLAQNIEAMGFAYAFDANGDGGLDTYKDTSGNKKVIWAVDSDGDNDLDINLDTDEDGDIDAADGPGIGNTGLIGGQELKDFDDTPISDVACADIRAVRIYLLARSGRGDSKFINSSTYTVGHKVISPLTDADNRNDNRRMRLLITTVKCRNLELN